ncbi:MAG: lysozyme inhibitor LprI family protein [Allorhizobium sp.]
MKGQAIRTGKVARRWGAGAILAVITLFVSAPAHAEDEPDIDCSTVKAEASPQVVLTYCASRAFEEAEAVLSEQLEKTKAILAGWDDNLEPSVRGAEEALLQAQASWLVYRDQHCRAGAFFVRGGSMERMVVYQCMADATRKRTEELRFLAMGNGL